MENKFDVIGLMSGTSLDGLDIAFCRFEAKEDLWSYKILKAQTDDYPQSLKDNLQNSTALSGLELTMLDHQLGQWIGERVSVFTQTSGLRPDFISSHGHTVFHQPDKGLTLQIGNGYEIMVKTGLPVINDFRALDIALGGQGAPLVPIGDKLLFNEFDFCLNLGGISNISFDNSDERIAFDISPVNIVLNKLAKQVGQDYDKDGLMARSGHFSKDLFDALNSLPYYVQPYPKSLGIEWIEKYVFPMINGYENIANVLHTFCHHTAYQIGKIVQVEAKMAPKKLLATGGGAFNSFLLELIRFYAGENVNIVMPDDEIVSYKEALIFAFLGLKRWQGQPNVLKSVTGAKINSCGGTLLNNPVSI